jgi:hypothetical protein
LANDIDEADRKRKQTAKNDEYFISPWRSDKFVSHLCTQYSSMWEEYKKFPTQEKKSYVSAVESPDTASVWSFVQPEASIKAKVIAKQKISFVIDAGRQCVKTIC